MKKIFSSLNNINNSFWNAAAKATTNSINSLVAFRIIAGLCLITIYARNFGWLGSLPKAFFLPPELSPVNFFTRGFPPVGFFIALDVVMLIAAICITLGIKARLSSLIYFVVGIICVNFEFSLGKIGHSIMLYLVLACMSFSDWGTKLALVPDKPKGVLPAKSLALLAIFLSFAFFSAAFEKAQHWINFDPNLAGTARWYYNSYFNLGRGYFAAPALLNMPFVLFKVMDFTAVIFELSPLFFLLYSRKAWRLFLFIAASFHLVNTICFNIGFMSNGLAYLAFLNYDAIYNFFVRAFKQKAVLIAGAAAIVALVIFRIYLIGTFGRATLLFLPDDQYVQLWGILVVWLTFAACVIVSFFKADATPAIKS